MAVLSFIAGIFLIVTGLADVYYSIIHYEIYGPISMYLHKMIWSSIRFTALRLPVSLKKRFLSHGAPLMIILLLMFWLGIELLGFALVYYSGMLDGNHFYSSISHNKFSDALYMSGITLSTLGFGDVVPVNLFFRMTAVIEALIGFGIMTLSLTFILNIYRVIQQFRRLASLLHNQTGGSGRTWEIINHQKTNGYFTLDSSYIRYLDLTLVDWYESLHQFPVAYYFYSPRNYLSIPYTFRIIGELISFLRFGLPSECAIPNNLSVFSLHQEFISTINNISIKYLSHFLKKTLHPVTFPEFLDIISGKKSNDIYVTQFIQINRKMRGICRIQTTLQPPEMYHRYVNWLQFTSTVNSFVINTTIDHGYSPEEIYPGKP